MAGQAGMITPQEHGHKDVVHNRAAHVGTNGGSWHRGMIARQEDGQPDVVLRDLTTGKQMTKVPNETPAYVRLGSVLTEAQQDARANRLQEEIEDLAKRKMSECHDLASIRAYLVLSKEFAR